MPVVFITGSGRRLGKGLAITFAEKGWDVIVHYNHSEAGAFDTIEKIKKLGSDAIAVKSDILNYNDTFSAFNEATDKMGIPDVLVNNSGVFPKKQSLNEIQLADWDNVLNINLRGEFYCSKIYHSFIQESDKYDKQDKIFRIINIASIGAFGVWNKRIPYNVSKSGVIQLTKVLARELAPRVTVNCVCPGTIHIGEEPSDTDIDFLPIEKIPMKRYGTIGDVFEAVWFFANATEYITGQVISVDGGYLLR